MKIPLKASGHYFFKCSYYFKLARANENETFVGFIKPTDCYIDGS